MIQKIYDFYVLNYLNDSLQEEYCYVNIHKHYVAHSHALLEIFQNITLNVLMNEVMDGWRCADSFSTFIENHIKDINVRNIIKDFHPICSIVKDPIMPFEDTYLIGTGQNCLCALRKYNVNALYFIEQVKDVFLLKKWQDKYGGDKWYKIANLYIESHKYIEDPRIYIDSFISYEHNTGLLLSKSQYLNRDILNKALEHIKNCKDINELIPFCSENVQKYEHAFKLLNKEKESKMDNQPTSVLLDDNSGHMGTIGIDEYAIINNYVEEHKNLLSNFKKDITDDVGNYFKYLTDSNVRINNDFNQLLNDQFIKYLNQIDELKSLTHNIDNSIETHNNFINELYKQQINHIQDLKQDISKVNQNVSEIRSDIRDSLKQIQQILVTHNERLHNIENQQNNLEKNLMNKIDILINQQLEFDKYIRTPFWKRILKRFKKI